MYASLQQGSPAACISKPPAGGRVQGPQRVCHHHPRARPGRAHAGKPESSGRWGQGRWTRRQSSSKLGCWVGGRQARLPGLPLLWQWQRRAVAGRPTCPPSRVQQRAPASWASLAILLCLPSPPPHPTPRASPLQAMPSQAELSFQQFKQRKKALEGAAAQDILAKSALLVQWAAQRWHLWLCGGCTCALMGRSTLQERPAGPLAPRPLPAFASRRRLTQ